MRDYYTNPRVNILVTIIIALLALIILLLKINNNIVDFLAGAALGSTIVTSLVSSTRLLGEFSKKRKKIRVRIIANIDGKEVSIDADNVDNARELLKQFETLSPQIKQPQT